MSEPSRIPLFHALADLRRARTPGTIWLYSVLAAMFVLVASIPICGGVQNQLARAHHARPLSPATWAVFQLVPKMYSFAHRVLVTDAAMTDDTPPPVWINHYPARTTRFETERAAFVATGKDIHVLVRTAYQGHRWVSRFVVHPEAGGLVIEAAP
jgi:hypothetical protein